MIAVAFALPVESSDFVRLLANLTRQCDQSIRGELHGRPLTIIHTGVGERRCRARMDDILRQSKFKYLISSGFAGALNTKLQIGDLVLAENFSSSALLRSPPIASPESKWLVARMATIPRIAESAVEREHWAMTTGAAAVDMETEFIAVACNAYQIPLLSLRAISDTPLEPLPAPSDVLFDIEKQRTNYARLGRYLATHPDRLKSLIAFRQRIALSRRSLTTALDRLLRVDLI